ncbi:Thioredoxin reductase [bioreactor metagenome]|uniref:Thioredoxin reductase n=1 Tax=bioreactor metagenome TaxID=1076179 RepID=A0A644VBT7_9ZZZZ|nr:FAD-dependent oxidoreductase [Acidaminococcaceae bacterium]
MDKVHKAIDVVIIGSGVTGLTAALYTGRMKLSTIVLETDLVGGQIVNASEIENYPGFTSIRGSELVEKIRQQAEFFGASIDEFDKIVNVELTDKKKIVETESFVYEPKVVIIATGMTRRKLPLPEESRFLSKGIHYCELCDGHMYQDKTIAVVGGGNAALDAAKFLTKYAKKLYIIHRSPALTADALTQDSVLRNPMVEVLLNTEILKAKGDKVLETLELYGKTEGKTYDLPVDGLFVDIGVIPNTSMFSKYVNIDLAGNILAGEDCRTNVAGVFAAGDVRAKQVRQLTTAMADGTVAAILAEKYIEN